jgi:single-strand DNA-binding protein
MWNNQVTIIGNVGKEPDVRFSKSGAAVTSFSVAVSNGKNQDGSYKDPDWYPVTCFKMTAELAADQVHKGTGVCVIGKLHVNKWTDSDGEKKQRVEIIADNVLLQLKTEKKDKTEPNGFDKMGSEASNEDIPF